MNLNSVSPQVESSAGSTTGSASPESADSGKIVPVIEQVADGSTPSSAGDSTQSLDEIRNAVQSVRRNLEFSFNEDADMTIVTVTDSDTGEVIRQIPSEELVKLSAYFNESSNLLFSEKV